jgi:hypothetical protein
VNAQSSSYEQEQQQTPSTQSQPQNASQSAPIQSPPIHQMMQPQHLQEPIKEPVRSPNTNK